MSVINFPILSPSFIPDRFIRNSTLVRKGSSGPVPSNAGQAFASITVGVLPNVGVGYTTLEPWGVEYGSGLPWGNMVMLDVGVG